MLCLVCQRRDASGFRHLVSRKEIKMMTQRDPRVVTKTLWVSRRSVPGAVHLYWSHEVAVRLRALRATRKSRDDSD